MALKGQLIAVGALNTRDREDLFALMEQHYENVERPRFDADLLAKDSVLVLRDSGDLIRGFTTLKVYTIDVNGQPVRLVFSGDTIVHRDYWGELELPRIWIRAVHSLVKDCGLPAYWLLISKGYKTYRFLPVYFHTFFPCHNSATPPFEKSVMDTFGRLKYPGHYDPRSGVIDLHGERDYLKSELADVPARHLRDPHIGFFLQQNPGYARGDELVCLTRLDPQNIKPSGMKYLEGITW